MIKKQYKAHFMLKMIKKYYIDINNEMRLKVPNALEEIFINPLYHYEAV